MKPIVYFSREITPEKVLELYRVLGKELPGKIAVKVHSGEEGNQNFLHPEFWKSVVDAVNGTVVECNTAYEGARNLTEQHRRLLRKHGWSEVFDVDILDAEDPDLELPIPNGSVLKKDIVGKDIDTSMMSIVTDDLHCCDLASTGHLDHHLKLALEAGVPFAKAIQMVTINTATCFQMQADLGSIAPGKCADLTFIEDLKDFRVKRTVIDGCIVAEDGRPLFNPGPFDWPDWMTRTMRLGEQIGQETFRVPAADSQASTALVRAIRLRGGDTIAYEEHVEVPVCDGALQADPACDILKAIVFERHHASGTHAAGFVCGLGIHGAFAQTVAHDAHNLLVVGDNDADMALAANALVECGGGAVAVVDGEIVAKVALGVCGLMSTGEVSEVASQVLRMQQAWADMGCKMPSPFMTLGLLSLACIPELRLTNRGYVDCTQFKFVPLEVGE